MAFLQRVQTARSTHNLSSGAFTASTSQHHLDTESNAANDQLDTINGGVDGQFLCLQSSADSKDTWLIDGTGNIKMNVSANFQLNHSSDTALLIYNGALSLWCEIARSDNTSG